MSDLTLALRLLHARLLRLEGQHFSSEADERAVKLEHFLSEVVKWVPDGRIHESARTYREIAEAFRVCQAYTRHRGKILDYLERTGFFDTCIDIVWAERGTGRRNSIYAGGMGHVEDLLGCLAHLAWDWDEKRGVWD